MKWTNWLGIVLLILFVIWLFIPLNETDLTSTSNHTSVDEDESHYQPLPLEEKSIPNIDPNAYYWKYTPIHYYFSEDYSCWPIFYFYTQQQGAT